MSVTGTKEGTHNGGPRPYDGWPNVKAPERRAGRPIRKARERLEARRKDFDAMKPGSGWTRPGSLKR